MSNCKDRRPGRLVVDLEESHGVLEMHQLLDSTGSSFCQPGGAKDKTIFSPKGIKDQAAQREIHISPSSAYSSPAHVPPPIPSEKHHEYFDRQMELQMDFLFPSVSSAPPEENQVASPSNQLTLALLELIPGNRSLGT